MFELTIAGGFLSTLIANPHWILGAMIALVGLAVLAPVIGSPFVLLQMNVILFAPVEPEAFRLT